MSDYAEQKCRRCGTTERAEYLRCSMNICYGGEVFGRLSITPAAPTFTAADLERAWEMGRDAGAERAAGRWATRSEHASRLFEMDYPEAEQRMLPEHITDVSIASAPYR